MLHDAKETSIRYAHATEETAKHYLHETAELVKHGAEETVKTVVHELQHVVHEVEETAGKWMHGANNVKAGQIVDETQSQAARGIADETGRVLREEADMMNAGQSIDDATKEQVAQDVIHGRKVVHEAGQSTGQTQQRIVSDASEEEDAAGRMLHEADLMAGQTVGVVKGVLSEAGAKTGQIIHEADVKAGKVVDAGRQLLIEAGAKTGKTIIKAQQSVQDAAARAAEVVHEAGQTIDNTTKQGIQVVKNKAGDMIHEADLKTGQTIDQVKTSAREIDAKTRTQIQKAADALQYACTLAYPYVRAVQQTAGIIPTDDDVYAPRIPVVVKNTAEETPSESINTPKVVKLSVDTETEKELGAHVGKSAAAAAPQRSFKSAACKVVYGLEGCAFVAVEKVKEMVGLVPEDAIRLLERQQA